MPDQGVLVSGCLRVGWDRYCNWSSFSEIAFAFRITPELLLNGVIFAVVMGVMGGLLPAWRASRQTVAEALRAM